MAVSASFEGRGDSPGINWITAITNRKTPSSSHFNPLCKLWPSRLDSLTHLGYHAQGASLVKP